MVGAVGGSLSCAARSLSEGRGTNAGGEIAAIRAGAPSSATLVSGTVGDKCDKSGGAEAVCLRPGASGTASGKTDCSGNNDATKYMAASASTTPAEVG